MADIFRAHGERFRATHRLRAQQHRVMRAIVACRTPLLGAQAVQCDRCGLIELRYHSCRNRHCPKCQTMAKEHWLQARCKVAMGSDTIVLLDSSAILRAVTSRP